MAYSFSSGSSHPRSGISCTEAAGQCWSSGGSCVALQEAERRYPTSKVRSSGREEIPHVQGQGRQLWGDTHVPGKRNPSKTVGTERGHQRAGRVKLQSQTTSQSDHMDHSLVSLNETKTGHVGPPKTDRSWWRVLTKCGPLEKGMANHFSSLALRTPWTVWKGKKIRHWKIKLPRLVGAQYATGDQWRNNTRKNEGMESKQKQHPVVDGTGYRSRFDAVQSNIA